ncbi:MAG: cytochrome C [Nitrospirota bacterium]|nr:cytochrome C [Nitrospirota bacterium]
MRLIIVVVGLLALLATPVLAADTVTLKAKMGDVTFNHKAHGERETCKACHATEPPAKFAIGGKDAAHKMCGGCHTTKKAGPQANKCMDCHKKK